MQYPTTKDQDCMSIDVIIPIYNGARFIDRCLQSVVGQSIAVNKIFTVNDGSTDSTQLILEAWVERDSRVRPIKLPKSGVNAARNAGIKCSNADFIALLDVDDIWMPRKLELQLKVFRDATDSLGLVYGGAEIIDVEGNKIDGVGKHEPVMRGELYQALLQNGNLIKGSASNVMIRRDVFSDVGLFDESLVFGEDWDMWIRIAYRYKVDYVNDVTVNICQRSDSTQGEQSFESGLVRFKSNLTVLMKHAGNLQWTEKMIRQNHRMGFEVWRSSGYDYDVLRSIKAFMLKFDGIPDVLVKFHNIRYRLLLLRYYLKGSQIKRMLGLS
jgi:glycosyltransferase involved in cell wall biosynthesis